MRMKPYTAKQIKAWIYQSGDDFFWKKSMPDVGIVRGHPVRRRGNQLRIRGGFMLLKIVTWVLHYGEFPEGAIRIRRGGKPTCIHDLYMMTLSEIFHQRGPRSTRPGSTKVPGDQWISRITVHNNTTVIGQYRTAAEATREYNRKKKKVISYLKTERIYGGDDARS
jgi:hypothetical protein